VIPLEAVDLIPLHRKSKHVGLEVDEARRPKAAEEENRRPKLLVANPVLDISLLKDLLGRDSRPRRLGRHAAEHVRRQRGLRVTNADTQLACYFAKYEPAISKLGMALRAKLRGRLPGHAELGCGHRPRGDRGVDGGRVEARERASQCGREGLGDRPRWDPEEVAGSQSSPGSTFRSE